VVVAVAYAAGSAVTVLAVAGLGAFLLPSLVDARSSGASIDSESFAERAMEAFQVFLGVGLFTAVIAGVVAALARPLASLQRRIGVAAFAPVVLAAAGGFFAAAWWGSAGYDLVDAILWAPFVFAANVTAAAWAVGFFVSIEFARRVGQGRERRRTRAT
jgi:hypothetical protein